jgi:hypothetical protein
LQEWEREYIEGSSKVIHHHKDKDKGKGKSKDKEKDKGKGEDKDKDKDKKRLLRIERNKFSCSIHVRLLAQGNILCPHVERIRRN